MADIAHVFGSDLAIGPTGDLACVDGAELGRQRVLRRLLTNPGDVLWQPSYGAGLARFVGTPVSAAQLGAVVRSQIFRERAVARTPEPAIAARADATGTITLQVQYADAASLQAQALTFPLTEES
jgi:phage baseplate assembly protein W